MSSIKSILYENEFVKDWPLCKLYIQIQVVARRNLSPLLQNQQVNAVCGNNLCLL